MNIEDDAIENRVVKFVNARGMINATMRQVRKSVFDYDDLLVYCIDKGWNDAVIYVKYDKKSKIILNAVTIKGLLKTAISNSDFSKYGYDKWHGSMCSSTDFGMNYGIWQKFINMTFKYLYCFKGVKSIDSLSIPWDDLHCPIDSIIAKEMLKLMRSYGIEDKNNVIESIACSGTYGVNWNNINETQYLSVQSVIDDLCKRENLPSKLIFDFMHWKR